jgi:hypothetical protein
VLAPYRLRRTGATMLALALTASLAVASAATAGAQESAPQFTDLDQTVHGDAIRLVAEDGITTGYPDGTFRPRDDVRRDQMATFLARALELDPVTPTFPDVAPGPPHGDNIGAIAATDPPITTGYPDGTYRPMGYVTRGQLATFLAKGLDLPAGTSTFTDVPEGYVHAEAISALADADPPITQGYPDGTFRPNLLVKRDQMAAFLARGIPLPRQPDQPAPPICPGSAATTSAASVSPERAPAASPTTQAAPATERDSEDLVELETGDVLADASARDAVTALAPDPDEAGYATASPTDLGPAIPGIDFPLTSVLRTASGQLEVLTQDLPTSRGARVDAAGEVTATTTIPEGRRSWATTRIGNTAYVGQWGVPAGQPNLFRFSTTATGDRVARAVATVPTGNEFWGLTADDRGRLWAGTRAHNQGVGGLENGRQDGRHVVHRVDPSNGQVTNVVFCQPNPATTSTGLRPDVKQVAAVGDTLYVGTGQLAGGARLYAFEPGDRTDVPLDDVRDLTPQNVRSQTGIFALRADDRYVAFGTQASAGQTARLVVIDRATGNTRVNLTWARETSRIDAVSLHGDRVVATGFSGYVYDVTIPPTQGGSPTVTTHEPPVPGQFHRHVERLADGSLRGVTQRGVVWTLAAGGDVDRVNLVDTGAPVAPGLPHGLHVGSADVAVGASSAVTLRDRVDLDATPRTLLISGEGKALTSNPAGDTFVATYPNAGLWRVDAGGDVAEQVRSWNAEFRRPAAADFDPRADRVHVIARNDNDPMSDERTTPQANLQFRPSRLFVMDPAPSQSVAQGFPLGRHGNHGSPVSATESANSPVEASSLLVGDEEGGTETFVGDTFGGVQRVASDTGERTWYVPAQAGDADRPVVDISLVEDRLVVVHSGVLFARAGGTYDARTSIRELDPETGVELDYHRVAHPDVGREWAIPDAVTSGSVTVMASRSINRYYDRVRDDYWGVSHTYNYSFGGPYVELDEAGCALYSFVGDAPRPPDSFSNLRRSPVALGDCLPEPEEQPEDPQDPNDPGTEPGDPVDPDAG